MPELPEVEVARRQLHRWLDGAVLRAPEVPEPTTIRARRSTSPRDAHPDGAVAVAWVAGRTLDGSARHGKRLRLRFGDRWMSVHLGMSGWLAKRRPDDAAPRHARFGWRTADTVVWLVDTRRFGCVVPDDPEGLDEGMGPDAAAYPWDGPSLAAAVGAGALKTALMDQARIAGLGNIHAAEALFEAGLDPRTRGTAVDPAGWTRLAAAIPRTLDRALAATDTEGDVAYVSAGGDNPFQVYGREGSPCPRCGTTVVRFAQGGRSTWACPGCQAWPT